MLKMIFLKTLRFLHCFKISMQDISKVSVTQVFSLWKNVSLGILTLIAVIVGSELLPFYFAPVVGLLGASFLYSILYNNKLRGGTSCMLIPYTLFFCLISYSFISILVNVLYIWGWMRVPDEFIFFNDPYFPTLWMNPIGFLTFLVVYLRRNKLRICVECSVTNGSHQARGVFGSIMNSEKKFQLKNMMMVAGALTVVVWAYYLIEYQSINANGKDHYIFFWITLIALVLDLIYFLYRYYNLYLDLKENNELLSQDEIREMTNKTYLRFYVICGNKIYMDPEMQDLTNPIHFGMDTPFFTKRSASRITTTEVKEIIKDLTGGKEGELRLFFGQNAPDLEKHSVLRYFYFLDGNPEDYTDMNAHGQWMDFEDVKFVYSRHPHMMSKLAASDLTRLATILITQKTFNENGSRKVKLKSYQPSFDLIDVRDSKIDFQSDKWIKIAVFNSDIPFYKFRRFVQNLFKRRRK